MLKLKADRSFENIKCFYTAGLTMQCTAAAYNFNQFPKCCKMFAA